MSTDVKLSKAQISKLIQSGESFGPWLGIRKESTNKYYYSLTNVTSNAINKFEKKISGKRAVGTGKRFTLFILNEDMNDIIKIIKALELSGVLIDGVTETVKHETKKRKWISWSFVSTFSHFISTTKQFN